MGALECHVLEDGRIIVYHRADNVERRFTPQEFKRLVTFLLEYYREGTTELSPVVKVFPSNAQEFHEPPKGTDDEAVLSLWTHRNELYNFVDEKKLFSIEYFEVDIINDVVKKNLEQWKIIVTEIFQKAMLSIKTLKAATTAESPAELRRLYKQAKIIWRQKMEASTKVCDALQAYFDFLGLYDKAKCDFCPLFELMCTEASTELEQRYMEAGEENDENKLRTMLKQIYQELLPYKRTREFMISLSPLEP